MISKSEDEIRARINTIKVYSEAQWVEKSNANYALNELYWILGEQYEPEGSK